MISPVAYEIMCKVTSLGELRKHTLLSLLTGMQRWIAKAGGALLLLQDRSACRLQEEIESGSATDR